jgi:hypothetical protein
MILSKSQKVISIYRGISDRYFITVIFVRVTSFYYYYYYYYYYDFSGKSSIKGEGLGTKQKKMSRINKLREEMHAAMLDHDASIEVFRDRLGAQCIARDAALADPNSTEKRNAHAAAEAALKGAIAAMDGVVAKDAETRFTEAAATSVFVPVQSLAEVAALADNEEATLITPATARKCVRYSMRAVLATIDEDASGEEQDRMVPLFRKALETASKGTRLSKLGGVPAEGSEMEVELETIEVEEAEFEGMTTAEAHCAMEENCYDGLGEVGLEQARRLLIEHDKEMMRTAADPQFESLFY